MDDKNIKISINLKHTFHKNNFGGIIAVWQTSILIIDKLDISLPTVFVNVSLSVLYLSILMLIGLLNHNRGEL